MFKTGANCGGIFVEGHITPSCFWPQFFGAVLFRWYCPDISHSLLESESEDPLEDESSAHVEGSALELEELHALVLEAPDPEDIGREAGAKLGSPRWLPGPEASFTIRGLIDSH